MVEALEVLFSSSARVRVLALFLRNPGRPFYQREIERETGQPIRAVQREVERLEGIGLLRRTAEGNRIFYGLNPAFPLLAELTALFRRADDGGPLTTERTEARQKPAVPPQPVHVRQPFAWMETPLPAPLPASLRARQVEGEWDRGY